MGKKVFIFLSGFFIFLFILGSQTIVKGDSNYVGSEACKSCHEASFNSYAKSIHAKKAIQGSPVNKEGCESCHGPGAEHAGKGGGKGEAIFTFGKKINTKEKSSRCLACHEETTKVAFWDMSKHKSAQVSCDHCHSVHSAREKNLKTKEPELCFACHLDVKAKTNKQSHHPVKEGKIKCNDCHNPHGTFGSKMVNANTSNELCYKCHAEKRGPYMWEHAPVEENCLNCHTVHGSNHSKLLVRKMPQLCQSCHDWTSHAGNIHTSFETFQGSSPAKYTFARSCLNCHPNIHGSNGPFSRGMRFLK